MLATKLNSVLKVCAILWHKFIVHSQFTYADGKDKGEIVITCCALIIAVIIPKFVYNESQCN